MPKISFVSTMHAHTSSINFIFFSVPKISTHTKKLQHILFPVQTIRKFDFLIDFRSVLHTKHHDGGKQYFSKSKCLGVDNKLIDSNTQHRLEFIDHHRTCPHWFNHSLISISTSIAASTLSFDMVFSKLAIISCISGSFCCEINNNNMSICLKDNNCCMVDKIVTHQII